MSSLTLCMGTECTEVCIQCEGLPLSELVHLLVLCVRNWAYTVNICHLLQYDIPSERECRLDEVPIEIAPREEWLLDDAELNTVTLSNMSIDSKLIETDGKRGRYREITVDYGAGESVMNPDEWPNVDLRPSKSSVKGQRYVGPGGENGESPYRTTRWRRHLKSSIPWSQSPQALACSVGDH